MGFEKSDGRVHSILISGFLLACLSSLSFYSCSHTSGEREIASAKERFDDGPDILENILLSLDRDVDRPVADITACSEGLREYFEALRAIRPQDVDVATYRLADFERFVELSFSIRLRMREQLKRLFVEDDLGESCLTAYKDTYLALRYVEDYLIEVYYNLSQVERPERLPANSDEFLTLQGESPFFNVNPKFKDSFTSFHDLKSGDVILSRGNAYTSAAIARIGNDDMQFSHLSLVYEHPSGELFTVEAHIEIGSFAAPLQQHLDQRNARTVVFRHPDSELAHSAAEIMYQRVREHQLNEGENIPYDFSMNYQDNSALFCSEIIYWGYLWASDEKLDVPRFKTSFEPELLPFLEDLNIAVNASNIDTFKTFAPGDMQFEPDFDLVAEWRNPARVRDSRFKDMILTSIFNWMKEEDYAFHPSTGAVAKSRAAWIARRLPIVKRLLEEQFPLNMSVTQLELFMVLDSVGDTLYEYLEQHHDDDLFNPLAPTEIMELLEKYRLEDAKRYSDYQRYRREAQRHRSALRNRANRPIPQHLQQALSESAPHFHQWYRVR